MSHWETNSAAVPARRQGWSKVSCEVDGNQIIGYIQNQMLSDTDQIEPENEEVEVKSDATVLDYPGRKDGEEIGEVLELDQVKQTGTVNKVWSRIEYQNADGTDAVGYIPTSCLNLPETAETEEDTIDKDKDAGTLHESMGKGVFADALEEDEQKVTEENGVQVGTPIARLLMQILWIWGFLKLHIIAHAASAADRMQTVLHQPV